MDFVLPTLLAIRTFASLLWLWGILTCLRGTATQMGGVGGQPSDRQQNDHFVSDDVNLHNHVPVPSYTCRSNLSPFCANLKQSKYDIFNPGKDLFTNGMLANHDPSQYMDSSFPFSDKPNCIGDGPISDINLVVPAGYRFCTSVKSLYHLVNCINFENSGPKWSFFIYLNTILHKERGKTMEKVKINEKLYDLVANGVQLTDQGGKIIFQPGDANFAVVEADVQAAKAITVLNGAEEPILTRSDLVYAGCLAKNDNYVVGTEQVQAGMDPETGEPIMETRDVIGAVMIVEFRAPDLREQLAATEAKLEYVAMMSGIEMEV